MSDATADPFIQVLMPRLFRHFSHPSMKVRLRGFFGWGYSFEQWFKWETVAALDPVLREMSGDPWDYCQWHLEYRRFRRQLGIVDMAFLGARPLMLHLKVFTGWSFNKGHIAGRPNSLLHDVERVRAFSRPNVTAATLLLLLECPKQRTNFAKLGVPAPENPRGWSIPLGTVDSWPDCTPQKVRGVCAKLLYWTNHQHGRRQRG